MRNQRVFGRETYYEVFSSVVHFCETQCRTKMRFRAAARAVRPPRLTAFIMSLSSIEFVLWIELARSNNRLLIMTVRTLLTLTSNYSGEVAGSQ